MKKTLIITLSALLLLGGCSQNTPVENYEIESPAVDEKEEISANTENKAEEKEDTKKEEPKKEENKKEETQKEEQKQDTADKKPAQETPAPEKAPQQSENKKTSEDVIKEILTGVDTPNYELTPINSENFSYYMFIDYIEGAKGYSADALISSTAHSVCLIELPQGVDAMSVASQIKNNADPAKWICVEAEAVEVAAKDNMVLLVMSDSATTSAIVNNFRK